MRWIPAAGYALLLLLVSTMSGEQLPRIDWVASPDKWAHLVAYALFTWLLFWPLEHSRPERRARQQNLALLISAAYGLLMEVLQYAFFPGRYFEVWDLVANISGATLAWVVRRKFAT